MTHYHPRHSPLSMLIGMHPSVFSWIFGRGRFLPVMSIAQKYIEPYWFSYLAYSVFSYLFEWWDHHWVAARKVKYFQFTPRPVSTRLIADWLAGWGRDGQCLYTAEAMTLDTVPVPLTLIYGTSDYLVDGDRLVAYLKHSKSFPMLQLVHTETIEGYEHMDTIWAHNNYLTTYPILLHQLNTVHK